MSDFEELRLYAHYRTAFVTGASTGLGRAFTEMLLAEGLRVWGTTRELERLDALVAAHRGKFTAVGLDLAAGQDATDIFIEADRVAGGFDIVINNAGYGVYGDFTATDFSVWREQLEVMLVHTAQLTHAALAGMRRRNRGAIVNLSSLAAEFPLPFQSAYNVAKAGLSALNESLMLELAGTGVIVIDLRPGDYRTDFEGSVRRPGPQTDPRMVRGWTAFERMMRSGPPPAHAAAALRRALFVGRSRTLRCGRFFQAVVAPFLARFGSLKLRRKIQARYFDVN
jgi:short-subunit dehydrogenase